MELRHHQAPVRPHDLATTKPTAALHRSVVQRRLTRGIPTVTRPSPPTPSSTLRLGLAWGAGIAAIALLAITLGAAGFALWPVMLLVPLSLLVGVECVRAHPRWHDAATASCFGLGVGAALVAAAALATRTSDLPPVAIAAAIVIGAFCAACAALASLALPDRAARRIALRIARNQCPACGYDLQGNPSPTSPECGR
jgi:hypothetical protein